MNLSNSADELDRRLDRLVDGELPADQYRALLAALDEQPDGWRRCALAFLEAQAWRRDVGRLWDEPARSGFPSVSRNGQTLAGERDPVLQSQRRPGRGAKHVFAGALAVSLLLAFWLGSQFQVIRARWQTLDELAERQAPSLATDGVDAKGNLPPATGLEAPATGLESSGRDTSLADRAPASPTVAPMPGLAAGDSPALEPDAEPFVDAPRTLADSSWGSATLFVGHDGEAPLEVDVPVFPFEKSYTQLVLNAASSIPEGTRDELLELGFDVRQNSLHWLPLVSQDGCQILVPYSEVEITQLTPRAFQ